MDGDRSMIPVTGLDLLERLHTLPGGPELLELTCQSDGVELVGGAVRDLLSGEGVPRELDVVVEGDAGRFAERLATLLGGDAKDHERFGTVVVSAGAARVDFATRRAESYPAPGALPEVRPGTPEEDLARRDFTVNAIAVSLGGASRGAIRHVPHALEDLRARRLRVLHGGSFHDDPTRLWRLARYRARLGFEIERETAELAASAIAEGATATVSGARIGAELRLALGERDAPAALAALAELGVLSAVHPRLRVDLSLIGRALALLPADGRADLLVLAAVVLPLGLRADGNSDVEIAGLLERLEFPRGDRERVVAAALAPVGLLHRITGEERPSRLWELLREVPIEGVALAGASSPLTRVARDWLGGLRHVGLEIDGTDLLEAGIPEGPEIGRRLELALRGRLDGTLAAGRAAELQAALEP